VPPGTDMTAPQDITIIVADLKSKRSIESMVSATKVLLSAAGPYMTIGTPIVEACVRQGTHYCDISGNGILYSG
jgi:short subunit dehydrogenase-like uncharacterized protein